MDSGVFWSRNLAHRTTIFERRHECVSCLYFHRPRRLRTSEIGIEFPFGMAAIRSFKLSMYRGETGANDGWMATGLKLEAELLQAQIVQHRTSGKILECIFCRTFDVRPPARLKECGSEIEKLVAG